MALMVLRRKCLRLPDFISVFRPAPRCFSSRFSNSESGKVTVTGLSGCGIETVDDDVWHVSSSLSQAWRQFQADTAKNSPVTIQGVRETILDDEDPDRKSVV